MPVLNYQIRQSLGMEQIKSVLIQKKCIKY